MAKVLHQKNTFYKVLEGVSQERWSKGEGKICLKYSANGILEKYFF